MTQLGPALRLLPRLRRPVCDPADLLAAVHRLCAAQQPGRRLTVVRDDRGTALVLDEAERSCRVGLHEFAEDVVRSQQDVSPAGLDAALQRWLQVRPVPDAEAARHGVAVLAWADARESSLAWQVVVQRGHVVVDWVPHPFTPADEVLAVRSAALLRSADVAVRCSVEGPVLLLDADEPLLATAACATPEHVLATAARSGLDLRDARVVVTPGRPVAWAEPTVAARLAGETVESCLTLGWRELPDLPWR